MLRIDTNLQPPDRGETEQQRQRECGRSHGFHLRLRREKMIAAAVSTTAQYSTAYSVFCAIKLPGITRPCAAKAVTSKFSKFGNRYDSHFINVAAAGPARSLRSVRICCTKEP